MILPVDLSGGPSLIATAFLQTVAIDKQAVEQLHERLYFAIPSFTAILDDAKIQHIVLGLQVPTRTGIHPALCFESTPCPSRLYGPAT